MKKSAKATGRKFGVALAAAIIATTALLTIPKSANAEYDYTTIMQKAMLAGLNTCISSSYLNSEAYLGAHDLGSAANFANVIFNQRGKGTDGTVKLPTKIGNSLRDSDSTCSELLLGYNGVGKNDLSGFAVPTNLTAAAKWMEALGYEKVASTGDSGSDSMQCAYVQYNLPVGSSTTTQKTNELCFGVDADGKIKNENGQAVVSASTESTATAGNILIFQQYGPTNLVQITTGVDATGNSIFYPSGLTSPLYGHTLNELKTFLEGGNYVPGVIYEGLCISGSSRYCKEYADVTNLTLVIRNANQEESKDNSNYYKLTFPGGVNQVKASAIEFFSSGKYNSSSAKFDNSDRYMDYTYTLFNLFGIKTNSSAGCGGSKSDLEDSSLAIKLLSSSGSTIYVQLDESSLNDAKKKELISGQKGVAYVVDSRDSKITDSPVDVSGIIGYLEGLNTAGVTSGGLTAVNPETCIVDGVTDAPTTYDPGAGGQPGADPTDPDANNELSVSQCIESAGSLGWIMCPVLDVASDATMSLYDYIQNNFLWIGSDVMGTETHEAWTVFRDYANIVFIVAFLVVILSQVTGFGVSNYGIKKILPRLIAVVLLTNLSFVICQLAVDLSDLIGAGLNTALSSLGGISEASTATYGVSSITRGVRNALFGTELGAGLVIAGVTWRIWLLPFLLAIIGALVGVFMFFLSLAVREAGIIILVVLCPVAIVCYALPNTKKLFDKWFRIFSSLLMVYPICGLLMGGGQFASSLLVRLGSSSDDARFMFTLTAMLLSVVPFFFIPTIVRTSLNAIGQLGARLSNFGRGLSGRITGGIRNSERFRDAQRELAARQDEHTVRNLDRWGRVRKAIGLKEYSASGQRRRSRAYARADKARREELVGQSYNGRSLLRDDGGRQRQLLGNLAARDYEERVNGAKATYRDNPKMATEQAIVDEHDRLLEEFGNAPDNMDLQSKLRALEEMAMEKGAPGQDMLQQSFAKYIAKNNGNRWSASKAQAISKLSAGLATRYGKDLNGTDKGFNVAMNDFANGDYKKIDSFRSERAADGSEVFRSDYDSKLAGFTAMGMSKATPGALQRGFAALRANEIASDNALSMISNASQALDDERIANDLKPAEKSFVQGIAGFGASMQGNSSVITGLGQGSLENLAQFVDSTNDTNALMQLGQNIQNAAGSSHLYGEGETSRLKMIINKINSKAGTSYTFDPASFQVNQGGQGDSGNSGGSGGSDGQNSQQDISDILKVSDAERAQLEADAAKRGIKIK